MLAAFGIGLVGPLACAYGFREVMINVGIGVLGAAWIYAAVWLTG
jgi:hypothetical protein